MNYTIKATNNNVTIGSQSFNTSEINLATISCLSEEYYGELETNVSNGFLQILLNSIPVQGLPVLSALFSLLARSTKESYKIKEDLLLKERYSVISDLNPMLKIVDASYDKKTTDGVNYYRMKRAVLVKKIIDGDLTENDADYIDVKLERVQQKLNTGDWKSAKKRLLDVVIEGAFTQSFYDEYESDIDNYIANNY